MIYAFRCEDCKKTYQEWESRVDTEGKFVCENCGKPLQAYDLKKVPSLSLTITLKDHEEKTVEEIDYFSTPWNPIGEETYKEIKNYCSKSLKLVTPKDI